VTESLQRLVMHAFRGVPGEMVVDFGKGESIAVYGENGTGKSTIADALEWYFTGEIELLCHEGRQHAVRYVGGDRADVTSVEVATNGTLGGKVLFPDERAVETLQVTRRETFLLRGRTLSDFINKTKTEKWKALVEILGLDAVESLREDLQRARNDLRKQAKAAEERVQSYRRALASEGEAVTEDTVLANLQQICSLLGVDPPRSLDDIDSSWIMAAVGASTGGAEPSHRESLLSEVRTLNSPIVDTNTLDAWNALVSPERAKILSRVSLVREAKRLFETGSIEGRCPLCGQAVDERQLALRIESALVEMMEASQSLESHRDAIVQQVDDLSRAHDKRLAVLSSGGALAIELPPLPPPPGASLRGQLDELAPVAVDAITNYVSEIRKWDRATVKLVQKAVGSRPGTRDTQLVMLAALCEQIRNWRAGEKEAARAMRALSLADRVFDAYQTKQKEDLTELLKQISGRVAQFYAALHPGEDLAGVSIEPWTAKGVELAIEFHGSRQRPPHGVLSESHLNSLAISLFLAMAETFNEQLGFLVLDDVINSFDVEHRGRLAELLADGFPNWQIIVLTHDQQFFEHLSRRAPSWRKLELTSWSYASGPRTTQYETAGILTAARERLESGDVQGAATKARRALEELLQEVCEALSAPLPFRRGQANDKREIGELFKGVRRTLKEHAKALLDSIDPLFKHLEADVGATLNVEVHGSRGRAAASEVMAALDRITALDETWSCPECRTRVWHRGTPDAARCKCGRTSFPPVRAS
jgi:energy-coupling factor transporter ATP-binding protein EcfA2